MTPLTLYQEKIAAGLIEKDPQQFEVIQQLEKIYKKLIQQDRASKSFLGALLHPFIASHSVPGLYLWGSVGVGKTFLIDLFYSCVPVKKMRVHFHDFMKNIHQQLGQLRGQKNPLEKIAKHITDQAHVLCLDEFMVHDIADAMILTNLLTALFDNHICLITTSNVEPDNLYKNGLQRELFLPAIALIKQHTTVFHIISHHDYRLMPLTQAGVYFTPLDKNAEDNMEKAFAHCAGKEPISTEPIEILDRPIRIRKKAGDTIWFDFLDLCNIPRSQNDYIEIAKQYKTVLISHIPVIRADQHNLITAFIHLIDIFYDNHIRVIISAEAPIEDLYPAGRLRFSFARTQSRLIEMQSIDYFTYSA